MNRWGVGVVAAMSVLIPAAVAVELQPQAKTACNELLPAARDVKGRKVGATSCEMVESQVAVAGKQIVRLDIGLDGTAEGYVTRAGEYRGYMTNSPELAFAQTSDPGEPVLAFADYRRAQGAAMLLFIPQDPAAWNGKLWVMAHGAGPGTDRPWDAGLAGNAPGGAGAYPDELLARGFAVAVTRRAANAVALGRNANPPPTGVPAVLEDGTKVDYVAFNDSATYIKDFTNVADKFLERRLKRLPTRRYFYGHSAGARIGRGMNYTAGLNRRADGKPFFDGFFVDDSAAGTWLPVVMKGGKDVLFTTDAERTAMVPQFEVAHQGYNNIWPTKRPDWVSESYLENKRRNAKIMQDKGVGSKFRIYEVRGISHAGSGPGLNIAPMWGQFFAMFDAWVDKGVAPPPSRSDVADIGDADRDGRIENPAIAFPQLACPMGVYYTTTTTATSIAFAPYTGNGLEPLNEEKIFVDMNRNGVWDRRESLQQAWSRIGLLKPGESVTREKYVACVQQSADALRRDGFFSEKTAAEYIDTAKKIDLQPQEIRRSNER
jgi:Alpha/beta hydrolase domain